MDAIKEIKSCKNCIHGISDVCIAAESVIQVIATLPDGFFENMDFAIDKVFVGLAEHCDRYKYFKNYKEFEKVLQFT